MKTAKWKTEWYRFRGVVSDRPYWLCDDPLIRLCMEQLGRLIAIPEEATVLYVRARIGDTTERADNEIAVWCGPHQWRLSAAPQGCGIRVDFEMTHAMSIFVHSICQGKPFVAEFEWE